METKTETIKVRYLPGSPVLEQTAIGGCVDLYNYEDVTLHGGEFTLINLGIACEVPDGYDLIVIPRSSTFKRYGIIQPNSPGYVDHSYCGNDDIIFAPALATRNIFIPHGTRCFQMRLVKCQPPVEFQMVASLSNANRGGHGSTGK